MEGLGTRLLIALIVDTVFMLANILATHERNFTSDSYHVILASSDEKLGDGPGNNANVILGVHTVVSHGGCSAVPL